MVGLSALTVPAGPAPGHRGRRHPPGCRVLCDDESRPRRAPLCRAPSPLRRVTGRKQPARRRGVGRCASIRGWRAPPVALHPQWSGLRRPGQIPWKSAAAADRLAGKLITVCAGPGEAAACWTCSDAKFGRSHWRLTTPARCFAGPAAGGRTSPLGQPRCVIDRIKHHGLGDRGRSGHRPPGQAHLVQLGLDQFHPNAASRPSLPYLYRPRRSGFAGARRPALHNMEGG